MYKEEYYDYSGKEGKWIKDELKKRGFHHLTISSFPADFFRMSKSQLEKLFEEASDAFISEMYDVPIQQIQNRRSDFDIKQLGCTINRMWREEELAQTIKEILRIVSNEYNNGNIPHTNSTPLNSEKEFLYMKATGIVRRIDDLGRVVIPKEIRRTMRIREGDPLEIYTSGAGEVIFKKYSPVGEMGEYANLLCFAAARQTEFSVAICDRDHCIASAGPSAKDMLALSISAELEAVMEARRSREFSPEEAVSAFSDSGYDMGLAVPIIASGDIAGAVAFIRGSASGEIGKSELSLANCISAFISRQLEL